MQPIDTIVHARWVIPVEPRGVVLEDHSVVVDGGRIHAIAPREAALAAFSATHEYDLDTHALVPGLVNAHTHAAMSLFRGIADDMPLMEWLEKHIWPAEARLMSESLVRDGTELAVAEMLLGGTTCFNDMYFFPDEVGRVAAETGIRAVIGMILLDFPSSWAREPAEYLAKAAEVHDQFKSVNHVTTAFAPHAPYTVSDGPLERVRVLSDELDVPVHIHVHETAAEVDQAFAETGERPLARLDRLGLVTHRLVAVHMTALERGEIDLLAARGSHVVHCAESNLKLASGFCPVGALRAAGVNVALGTDGAASNNDLDLIQEMRTASLLAKGVAGDASVMSAAQSLEAATLAGARALAIDDEVGSLEVGKSADLVAIDLGRASTQPVYHPLSQVVYAAARDQVSHVWVAGRALVERGRLATLDLDGTLEKAAQWRARMAEHGSR